MRKLIVASALLFATLLPATPASAHYDDWHNATCQGQWWLMYNWPSAYGGTRVYYWTDPTGVMQLDNPELTVYAQQGYECGWMGAMIHYAWIQQVCEFGYCGNGMLTPFANGWMTRHFDGPAAGAVAVMAR